MDSLQDYGWNKEWQQQFDALKVPTWEPARVIEELQGLYRVVTRDGQHFATLAGRFRHLASSRNDLPTVGDWIAIQTAQGASQAVVHALLSRKSSFTRKLAGFEQDAQVVAANVNTLFLVNAANDVNERRIERYLTIAWDSGSMPVIVFSKSDLVEDGARLIDTANSIAPFVPVHLVSAATGQGLDTLAPYLLPGETVALLGMSGAGKSSLVNYWMSNEAQRVQDVRTTDLRGRHTTTTRTLFRLPNGTIVIDTPGMRELQLWDGEQGLHETFGDVEKFAAQCRYRDCSHQTEPGCAVQSAIHHGTLDTGRFRNYMKLQRELARIERKQSTKARVGLKHQGKQHDKRAWQRDHAAQKDDLP